MIWGLVLSLSGLWDFLFLFFNSIRGLGQDPYNTDLVLESEDPGGGLALLGRSLFTYYLAP